jgi:hypothetical protein
MPVIGGGLGLNFVELNCEEDFVFDVPLKLTGEQPCDEVEPSAEDGEDVIERFDGEGDREDGDGNGLNVFNLLLLLLLLPELLNVVESLSTPPSEQRDSLSVSLFRFLVLLTELLHDRSVGSIDDMCALF